MQNQDIVGPVRHYPNRSWYQVTFMELLEDPYHLNLVPAMLMGFLHVMADKNAAMGKDRSCRFSLQYLANKFHVNAMTIRRHIAQLEKFELLEVDRDGIYENTYHPRIPESWMKAVEGDSPLPF